MWTLNVKPTRLKWTNLDIWLTTYPPHLVHMVFEWPPKRTPMVLYLLVPNPRENYSVSMGYHACLQKESVKKGGKCDESNQSRKRSHAEKWTFFKNNTINQSSSISNDPCKSNQSMTRLCNRREAHISFINWACLLLKNNSKIIFAALFYTLHSLT